MREGMKRILVLLKVDLKQYFPLVIIFSLLPIMIFNMFSLNNKTKGSVVILGASNTVRKSDNMNYVVMDNKEQAIALLEENNIQCVIDMENQEIYLNEQQLIKSKDIENVIQDFLGEYTENISDKIDDELKTKKSIVFLCTLLVFVIAFIGGPIIFLGEKSTGMFKALALTPLRYEEYLICKVVINVILSLFAYLIFFIVTRHNIESKGILALNILLVSILITIVAGIISMIFSKLETTLLVMIPILIGIIIVELQSWLENIVIYLPIQEGFKAAIIYGKLDFKLIILYIILILISSLVYVFLYKQETKRD